MGLTPKERIQKVMKGERPDILPLTVINSNSFICSYYDLPIQSFLTEPARCAECYGRFIDDFQVDGLGVATSYILYGCGPELGVEWTPSEGQFPAPHNGPLRTEQDVENFEIPAKPSGYFSNYLSVLDRIADRYGETHQINGIILAPFTVACFLRGMQNTMLDTINNKSFYHKYMELAVNVSTYLGGKIIEIENIHPVMIDIFVSPEMISPETYFDMVDGYSKDVQTRLTPEKAPNSMGVFMGKKGDREFQRTMAEFYRAFYGISESVESIKKVMANSIPGYPFPISISGRALAFWETDRVINFIDQASSFLIKEANIYPSISLASVQAETKEKALMISETIDAINTYRQKGTTYVV